jgi:endogenous inhibitor of DNA gyrase (YacG/DUF329 family)
MILKCPRCGKGTDAKDNPFRPFCSERCKLLDLGNWITGSYRIKGSDAPEDDKRASKVQKDSEKE